MYVKSGAPPLFKIYGPEGHVWKIWLDGRMEGFPPDSLIINHAEDMLPRRLPENVTQLFPR